MTRLAILAPTTLLGQEMRGLVDAHAERWAKVSLLTTDEEEAGTITESLHEPALVTLAGPDALHGIDLVFACGELEDDLAVISTRPPGCTAILLSPRATARDGRPMVAGWSPPAAAGEVVVSPHPAAVALTHLLAPLHPLGMEGAAATVVLPSSLYGAEGLEGLLEQTKDILAMTGKARPSVFNRQLAFNVFPAPDAPGDLAEMVRQAGDLDVPVAIHVLQGAVFHGVACSVFVRFAADPGGDAVRAALAAASHVSLAEADLAAEEIPGTIDAAAREDVLVGGVRPDPGYPAGYWLWAVVDNLTRGGASNALEIADTIVVPS